MGSRIAAWLTAWAVLATVVLLLGGCAATAPAQPSPILVAVPCPTARDLPDEPPTTLTFAGFDVRPYIENRAAWIAHSRDLRTRLESCK